MGNQQKNHIIKIQIIKGNKSQDPYLSLLFLSLFTHSSQKNPIGIRTFQIALRGKEMGLFLSFTLDLMANSQKNTHSHDIIWLFLF